MPKFPIRNPLSSNDSYTYNWAGYYAKNDTYDDIKASWNTQCLGSNQASNVREASWVGMGGINGNQNIWQAGTIYASDGLYHPIWQAYPSTSLQINWNIGAACGVHVSTETYLSHNNWCYYINVDGFVSSGCPLSASIFHPDQSTAEWIDERPTCTNGYVSHLADFQYTNWTGTFAHSPIHGWHTIEGFATNKDHMRDNRNGNILAEPDNFSSSTSFTDRYKNQDTDGVNCNSY